MMLVFNNSCKLLIARPRHLAQCIYRPLNASRILRLTYLVISKAFGSIPLQLQHRNKLREDIASCLTYNNPAVSQFSRYFAITLVHAESKQTPEKWGQTCALSFAPKLRKRTREM